MTATVAWEGGAEGGVNESADAAVLTLGPARAVPGQGHLEATFQHPGGPLVLAARMDDAHAPRAVVVSELAFTTEAAPR